MAFFKRLFGGSSAESRDRHALAMVMQPNTEPVDAEAVLNYLGATWHDVPAVLDRDVSASATTARIPGGMIAIAHMPVPIPSGDLVAPTAWAWHWPGAAEAVGAHASHVIVHARSTTLSAVELRLLHTKLVASVLAVGNGAGVYLGDAALVRSATDFMSDAQQASVENLPLLSWIGFTPVQADGATSAHTMGLSGFDLLELEVRNSAKPVPEVLGVLADLASYQLSTGRVLSDGDTFGASELDRTRIRYGPSAFIPDTTVALVELG